MDKWYDRQFTEKETPKANKHMKWCSNSLVVKEMQIKMESHFTPLDRQRLEPWVIPINGRNEEDGLPHTWPMGV